MRKLGLVRAGTPNAFALGITVGHTENNDIVIEDESVSRFHAYFQQSGSSWKLVDTGSRLGTWLDEAQLRPNTATEVNDGAQLRFGKVQVTFLLPPSLLKLAVVSGK